MTSERWTKVTWDGLTAYPNELSKIYGAPLGIRHFGFLIKPQPPHSKGTFHHHEPPTEEIYVLLRGRGQLLIGDEVVEMRELDSVRVPPPIPHGNQNPYDEECWWMVLGAPLDEFIAWDKDAYTPIDTTAPDD